MIPLLQSGGTVSSVQTRNQTDQAFCFCLFFVQVCDSPLRGDAFLYGSLIFRLLETRVVVDLTFRNDILPYLAWNRVSIVVVCHEVLAVD